ncbi:MAG: hypothetical protein M3313_03950 [Actinomycetota bacterium]|nr:hypothetical protein [Actinomycetota bacterium]
MRQECSSDELVAAWTLVDGDLTGPDREHAEVSMLALHLLQSALVHVNTLLLHASSTAQPGLPRSGPRTSVH